MLTSQICRPPPTTRVSPFISAINSRNKRLLGITDERDTTIPSGVTVKLVPTKQSFRQALSPTLE